jgi:hypothetical protein
MEMSLDITTNNTPQCPNEIINLSRIGTSNGISNTDSVNTNLVDGPVD